MTYEQVASEMGISKNAVKKHMMTAIRTLKECCPKGPWHFDEKLCWFSYPWLRFAWFRGKKKKLGFQVPWGPFYLSS